MKIAVTGATGFVGVPLVTALRAAGHEIIALVRNRARASEKLPGVECVDAQLENQGPWCEVIGRVDAIAHLAGETIGGKRWDARQKQLIRDSRVESTRTIVEAIGALPEDKRPRTLVCASGTDFYPYAVGVGDFDDDPVTEDDPPADTFLGRLCRDWEKEANAARAFGVRVVSLRTGLVLGPHGGVLDRMKKPFQFFAGGRLGDGRQFMSWVSLDDAVGGYVASLTDARYEGPINLVTASTRNAELARALGHVLHKPSWVPVPTFAVKIAAGGELAESILNGRNVVPGKLRQLGFAWKQPTLEDALRDAMT
jgi:uncharacterized protein (TIGR01777 family)